MFSRISAATSGAEMDDIDPRVDEPNEDPSESVSAPVIIECQTCRMPAPPSRVQRMMCSNCGNFLSQELAEQAMSIVKRKREAPPPPAMRGGAFNAIRNFFRPSAPIPPRSTKADDPTVPRWKATDEVDVLDETAKNSIAPIEVDKRKSCYVKIETAESRGLDVNVLDGKSLNEILQVLNNAHKTNDSALLQMYLSVIFLKIENLNRVFAVAPPDNDSCRFEFEALWDVFEILSELNDVGRLEVEKSILTLLLNMRCRNDIPLEIMRGYLILLHNPMFNQPSAFPTLAGILQAISYIPVKRESIFVSWLRQLPTGTFHNIARRIKYFMTCRIFPPKESELPPLSESTWWIPSAIKTLALLNAANNLERPIIVSYTEFYISALDHADLKSDYNSWQNPAALGTFNFCQYPFCLSLGAKRDILMRDCESQMSNIAKREIMQNIRNRLEPEVDALFLTITIRRENILGDSLEEIIANSRDMKKKLRVRFAGEPGVDLGGPTKEWFLLLTRQVFQPDFGMFTFNDKSGHYWFAETILDQLQEFYLVGVLMGLAMYNGAILDIHFPPVCYKKLLTPAVVPYSTPNASVGMAKVSMDELAQVDPDLANGLTEVLEYSGDVEADFCLSFQVSSNHIGNVVTHELIPNGKNVLVTNENRHKYVYLYIDWILNRSIYKQFHAFYHGFHGVVASNALTLLRPEEIEMLVCGNPDFDIKMLRRITKYENFTKDDQTIRHFWDILSDWPEKLQKRFLLFATGSDRTPPGGMKEMEFKISRATNLNMIPIAFTCFNQLGLPDYRDRKILKQKLMIAVENAEGFGLK